MVLTGGDVDAIAGLLTLRERQVFTVYATARVHQVLEANPIFDVLARDIVTRQTVLVGNRIDLAPGLGMTLFSVPGKVPLYLEAAGVTPAITEGEETVGVEVTHDGQRLFFIPGCARMTDALAQRLQGADAVLFDGTLWTDDEMVRAGLGPKTGQRMGHMSISDTLAAFETIDVRRKIFVHLNNSNPVLLSDSPERAAVTAAGWDVAHDGMELAL